MAEPIPDPSHIPETVAQPSSPGPSIPPTTWGDDWTPNARLPFEGELSGPLPEGGQRYTVKRYRSHKVQRGDGTWEHGWIRFEPLNPEFPAWEVNSEQRVAVLAEFVRVLD